MELPQTLAPSHASSIHEYAVKLARQHRRTEGLLVRVLDEIDTAKFYRTLGYSSLFTYSVSALGLSEATAYAMIAVARKAREVAPLREAVLAQELTVSKAAKIVSVLDAESAHEIIEFAKGHTSREIESEVARRRAERSRA